MLQIQEDIIELSHIQGQLDMIDLILNHTPYKIQPDLEFILNGWKKMKKEELEILNRRNKN